MQHAPQAVHAPLGQTAHAGEPKAQNKPFQAPNEAIHLGLGMACFGFLGRPNMQKLQLGSTCLGQCPYAYPHVKVAHDLV